MDVRLAVKVSRLFSRPIFLESQSTRLVEQTPDERGALMVGTQRYKRKLLDNVAQFDVGDPIHIPKFISFSHDECERHTVVFSMVHIRKNLLKAF